MFCRAKDGTLRRKAWHFGRRSATEELRGKELEAELHQAKRQKRSFEAKCLEVEEAKSRISELEG